RGATLQTAESGGSGSDRCRPGAIWALRTDCKAVLGRGARLGRPSDGAGSGTANPNSDCAATPVAVAAGVCPHVPGSDERVSRADVRDRPAASALPPLSPMVVSPGKVMDGPRPTVSVSRPGGGGSSCCSSCCWDCCCFCGGCSCS
ncbi:hypothetical protein Vretifemale_19593, partial [Volvox reticuliferus]